MNINNKPPVSEPDVMLRSRKLFGSDPSLAPLECRLRDEFLPDALLSTEEATERTESGQPLLLVVLLDRGVSGSVFGGRARPRLVEDSADDET